MKISRTDPSHMINNELILNSIESKFIEIPERMGAMNQSMFRDDFGNMFIGITRRNANIFNITSNNEVIQEELLQSFIRSARHAYDKNVFQEILEEIIQSLLYYGKAAYCLHDTKSDERIFRSLPPSTIFKFFDVLFQYLPRRITRNWDRDDEHLGREIRFLNRKRVLFFEWPRSVQRKIKSQDRMLRVLDKYAFDGITKHIAQPTHENPNPKSYFDFSVWRDARDEALFAATKHTGWSGRNTSYPKKSDFFICHRLLRLRRLQVETCIYLLTSLSQQLTSIGKLSSPEFKMQISFNEEFPALVKFDELEKRLMHEEIDFSEVLDFCFQKE